MKYAFLFIFMMALSTAHSQNVVSTDSLQRYCERLEKNEKIMVSHMKFAGNDINMGAGLLGGGLGLSIAGGLVAALSPLTTNSKGARVLGPGQVIGIILGTVGLSITIVGIAKIGEGGKRLKQL